MIRIKRDINIVYSDLISENRWWWLQGHAQLQLRPYISTGTVTVTSGSATVTFSTAPAYSVTGYSFFTDGFNEIYTIESHTANSTTAKLTTLYAGTTTSTATYKLWTDKIPLPTDCKETIEVYHNHHNQPMSGVGLQEFRRISSTQPKREGNPEFYTTLDFTDPQITSTVTSLPALSTRASTGLVKSLVFASGIPSSIATKITDGEPVRWRISAAGDPSYNGDFLITGVSTTTTANDTVSYVGVMPLTESATADTALTIRNIDSESALDRYRSLLVYPGLTTTRVTLNVDFLRETPPLENDSDEPAMPVPDRVVLLYGALHRAWSRLRNPEEASRNLQLYTQKLGKMEGKLQDTFDRPIIRPARTYLNAKRNMSRSRAVRSDSFMPGGGGSAGAPVITGTASRVAIFDSSGELNPDSAVTTTELNYLDGVTSNIQTQLDAITTLADGKILVGNASNAATEVTVSGDITISNAGVAAIEAGAIVNADVNGSAGIARTKLASGTASHVLINDGSGVMSSEAALAISRGGTGAATATAGFNALSPVTTKGDIIVRDGTNNIRLAVGANDQVLTADSGQTSGLKWATPSTAPDQSYEAANLTVSASVSSNALTLALKTKAASDASASDVIKIGFRNATAATGTYAQRTVTAALSVTVSSGSTLGHADGVAHYFYLYAIDNSGTVELAVSSALYDDGTIVSTTAEGGAGGADSSSVIYSTTARTDVPLRLLARIKSTQATAGTWASAPSEISLHPFRRVLPSATYEGCSTAIPDTTETLLLFATKVYDTHNAYNTGTGVYTVKEAGKYLVVYSAETNTKGATDAGMQAQLQILVNDAAVLKKGFYASTTASKNHGGIVTRTFNLAVGDTIKLRFYHDLGATTIRNDALFTFFSIQKVGDL